MSYATDKLLHHPAAMSALRAEQHQNPITIHFMPNLACNQHCFFCSYGHRIDEDGAEQRGWKNMELMSNAALTHQKMTELLEDWALMGVKAVELTGGGEPLAWLHASDFIAGVGEWGAELAIVTNGTALNRSRADLIARTNWKWIRVSIDAGTPETYTATRRVPVSHWYKAWESVRLMAERRTKEDQRVGVGFVVDKTNYMDVYAFCVLAKMAGADNVRVSMAFTPQGVSRLPEGASAEVRGQLQAAAAEVEDSKFKINNLFDERIKNILSGAQTYRVCPIKEVVCVVGGDGQAYTCCTLAFNKAGVIGSFRDQRFSKLWWSPETQAMFRKHDARQVCTVECLYEKRNKIVLKALETPPPSGDLANAGDAPTPPIHVNFI